MSSGSEIIIVGMRSSSPHSSITCLANFAKADPERPADPHGLRTEPDLPERMIELAYRTGAEVTLLEPAIAGPLSDADGVAALLRW